jgi:predicted nucleic acid-binding Zn ribbon protein
MLGDIEMDCPNCGVYNPEDRQVCWRCDQELPKPKEPKKRRGDPALAARRMWIVVGVAVLLWLVLTWLLPLLLNRGIAPTP